MRHCLGNLKRFALASLLAVGSASAFAHEGVHNDELYDAEHVQVFMDGVINTVMYQRQIPGAVLVIVVDGKVLFSKGYGFANAEKRTPIDTDRTLFRIASVSKTINATAVMQLVEQGKLDLNGEANDLLQRYEAPLSIAEHYSQKIRLLDLTNHTAGFDERAIGMSRLDKGDVPALGAYLAERMPPQVMEPRTTISYSNHGVALAGYLVELASGEPYAAYVRDHIFAPLGMTHSSMEWNEAIAPDLAQGYQVSGGMAKPVPFDNICIPPAGGTLTCGADMARFMIAHLQNGQLGDARILQESTAVEMHRMQYEQDPRLEAGMAVGFFTGMSNGHRYLEHGGDLNGFASRIWMLPDDGVGIFTSYNVDDDALRGAIVGQFMDRYFPDPGEVDPRPNADFAREAKRCAGTYRSNRLGRMSIEKLSSLMEQSTVTADDQGNLFVKSGGGTRRFVATENGVYVDPRDGDRAVFRTGNDGEVTQMLFAGGARDRLKWYDESIWHTTFILGTLALFFSATVGWPVAYVARVTRRKPWKTAPAYYRVTAWFVAALGLFLLVTLGATLMNLDKWEFTYGMPVRMVYLLLLPPVLAVGSVLLALNALAIWWRGYWSVWSRLHYTLVVAVCVSLVPFFLYWNLLGFNW